MPRISLALSEVIKRRLFRCREHIQCCNTQALEGSVHNLSLATYEIARGLNLPGVRREAGEKTSLYV
ncbi:MAG TPA: hypothetical protein VK571_11415, partial [Gemmatimonadaceae bacterium]|nr:hypothetical protein [Gemmatimonadaceae bacterium]